MEVLRPNLGSSWSTCDAMCNDSCRGAAAAVVVFDITNAESFTKAKNWVKELQRQGNPAMIMALAGNKADLAGQRAVTTEDAQVLPHLALLRLL